MPHDRLEDENNELLQSKCKIFHKQILHFKFSLRKTNKNRQDNIDMKISELIKCRNGIAKYFSVVSTKNGEHLKSKK